MRFSVNIQNDDIFPVLILKDKFCKTEIVVYSFGALLNSFLIDGKQNIIDGFASCKDAKENITKEFKNTKLSPFVCRIKKGEYAFQNEQYKTGKFFIGGEAIHGLIYDAQFTVTATHAAKDEAFVKLEYLYSKKDEGFPFEFVCEIMYRLEKENKLSVTTAIINKSNTEMPLCDGWHPYFTFGGSIDNLMLQINADKILAFDDELLPTGEMLPFHQFQNPEKLNGIVFDNCFLLKHTAAPACTLADEKNKLRLSITPFEAYPYLQVFTPAHRNSIAIENLSAAPDAFNNKMGLTILKPAEIKTFTTTFQAVYY